jgi:hypothetical protein
MATTSRQEWTYQQPGDVETARAEINYNKLDGDDVNSRKALERIAEGELGLR